MYDNYLFVLIYGLFVCMYVCTCARKVGISFSRSSTYTKYVVVRSSTYYYVVVRSST